MNKKLRTVVVIVVVLVAIFVAVDNYLGTRIVARLIDHQAPIINTDQLRDKHLIDREYDYSVISCTDNYDDLCEVVISNEIDVTVLGEQTFKIKATDQCISQVVITIPLIV